MKILYYSAHPNLALNSPAGYGTHMREMIEALEVAGHEVLPIIIGGSGNAVEKKAGGWTTKRFCKQFVPPFLWESAKDYVLLSKDLAFENHLSENIIRFEPDLIYERASYLQLSGIQAAKKHRVPHILEMNAPYVEERSIHAAAGSFFQHRARKIEKDQLSETDRTMVVSQALKDYFIVRHSLPPESFAVVPNAVNPAKVQVDKQRVAAIGQRFGLDGKTVVGFVGSLFRWHGVDRLIRALRALRSAGFDVTLLIVGDGAIMPELKQLCKTLEVSNHVNFTGNVQHTAVFDYIDAMDIAVMPNSNWYGSPVKIFEYGIMGKPVIAPNNGPVGEVIDSDRDGLLIDDEYDLVRQIRRLIESPSLRERLAASFQQKILDRYTWRHNADRVMEAADMLSVASR